MSFWGRVGSFLGFGKSTPEGAYHPGPYSILTTTSPGWLPAAWANWNHWQMDQDPIRPGCAGAMVEACVSAYAQTIAACPGNHWVGLDHGGRGGCATPRPPAPAAAAQRLCTPAGLSHLPTDDP